MGGCDAFGSSLYYLDALCKLAELGHEGFFRQSFVGGNYALLNTETLEPNPDYYTAVLFQRLMGQRVLPVTLSHIDPDLHVYAHCASGSGGHEASSSSFSATGVGEGDVAFAFVNRSPDKTFTLTLDSAVAEGAAGAGGGGGGGGWVGEQPLLLRRSEYHLTSGNLSDVFDRRMRLNGALLRMQGWAELPPLAPTLVDGSDPVHVDSHSVGFVILHGAKASACIHQ